MFLFFNHKQFSLFSSTLLFSFFVISTLEAQISPLFDEQQYIKYYTLLFYSDSSQNIPQGKILIPGTYPELNDDLKTNFISFETNFNLKYPNATTKLTFDKGFHDEGMVLINGEFIDPKIIKGKKGYTRIVPNGLLKEGNNTLTLLTIFHSPLWEFEGDIYLENGLERVFLNGNWDYSIHKNLETNFQRKPTQGLNVFEFFDIDIKSYVDSKAVTDWSKTNFPVEVEYLYNNQLLNGAFCFKKTITFDAPPKEDLFFTIDKGIDDTDRLYVNGYLVGSTDCFSCERRYRIPSTYLKKENDFTLFVIDKDGPGGVLSPIILKNKTTTMDISNQWSYNKLFELQLLVTLKNTETENSFFRNTDFKFYNISGEKLNFESLLLNYKSQLNLSTVVLLIISFVLASALIYFLRRRNNSELKKEKKLSSEKTQEHIFIRSDRADHKIIINEIVSIEGKKDYVKIQLESKSYLVRKNLKTFLLGLPSSKFVRINKSVAINLEKISKIQKNLIFLNSRNYHVISKNYVSDINDLTLR